MIEVPVCLRTIFPTEFEEIQKAQQTGHVGEKIQQLQIAVREPLVQLDQTLLIEIQQLTLSGKKWTLFTNEMVEMIHQLMPNLRDLQIIGTQLAALPNKIGELTQLRDLGLPRNQLRELPKELGDLTQLTVLNISDNPLTAPLLNMSTLTELCIFRASNINLKSIPDWIEQLSKLLELSFAHNGITKCPPLILGLFHLQNLNLAHNNLTAFLDMDLKEIEALEKVLIRSKLSTLNLSHNSLESLSPLFVKLENLETLDLSYNQLSEFLKEPKEGELTHLRSLILKSNQLRGKTPDWIAQKEREGHVYVDMSDNPRKL